MKRPSLAFLVGCTVIAVYAMGLTQTPPPWPTIADIDALKWDEVDGYWVAQHPIYDGDRYEIRASSGGYRITIVTGPETSETFETIWSDRTDAALWCLGDVIQDAAVVSNMSEQADTWLGRGR